MNYVLIKQHNTAENMTLQVSLKELNNFSQERNKTITCWDGLPRIMSNLISHCFDSLLGS